MFTPSCLLDLLADLGPRGLHIWFTLFPTVPAGPYCFRALTATAWRSGGMGGAHLSPGEGVGSSDLGRVSQMAHLLGMAFY